MANWYSNNVVFQITLPKVHIKKKEPVFLCSGCVIHCLRTLAVGSMDLGRSQLSQSNHIWEKLWLIHLCATWPRDWSFLFSTNFILRDAGSQQKLVSMYSWLNQCRESTPHASVPANWGRQRAVPCTITLSLLPYLHSWQLCWAPAAVRQLLKIPGHMGWDGREAPFCCDALSVALFVTWQNACRAQEQVQPACPSVLPPPNWTHTTGISKCNF